MKLNRASCHSYLSGGWKNRVIWPIVKRELMKWSSWQVMGGPFRGMMYVDESINSALYPKIMGTYEQEIAPIIEHMAGLNLECMINIGAGEGYYAVGFLYAKIVPKVMAFESEQRNLSLLSKVADLNGIPPSLIEKRGFCCPDQLETAVGLFQRSLVLCDVEGDEQKLIDPIRVPSLRRSYLLVEVHDFISEGIGALLYSRMVHTHIIHRVECRERTSDDAKICDSWILKVLPKVFQLLAVAEFRPHSMYWLFMTPRN